MRRSSLVVSVLSLLATLPLATLPLATLPLATLPLATLPLAAQVPAPGPTTLTPHQQLAHDVYKQLVEINTVDSVGSVTKAAEAMAARFRAAGFPDSDVVLIGPDGKPTKKNLIVRYHARSGAHGKKPLLLIAHLDVVAARRSEWPRDPFTLYEENGYFLGRGTADDKAMAAIFVANLLDYKKEGFKPDRDIILALTSDEESGDANGAQWLTQTHKPLIDAAYAINEGGGGVLDGNRPVLQSIQAAEKVSVQLTLTTTNKGGHSSVPRPDNAIYELASALLKIAAYRFPVALNEITRSYFERTAAVSSPDVGAAMRAIVANPNDTAAAATLSRNPSYASMLRTTCVATRLSGGHAYNALPQTATANVNCRIVPTSTDTAVMATLARVISDTGVKITYTVMPDAKFGVIPTPVPPELLAATTALTKQMWGDIPVIPTMSTGATDSRFLRSVGIPAYGVSGLFSAPGETNAHGRDEKLRVKSFYDGLAFLDQLVRRLSS